jgi:ATP-dependent protease HslVU (ClpYQ) peptidase subunit
MTCIVGIAHQGRVLIGGDSAATNGSRQQTLRVDPKVFCVGEVIFGCTSSFRMMHLLHYSLEVPALPGLDQAEALEKYLVTDFIDAVRTCFSTGGYAKKKEEREKGGTFLVGIRGRLFCVDDDYQVEETIVGYNAVGSGGDLALGSLSTTQSMEMSPRKRLEIALQAAAYHNSDTRPPFLFVTTGVENEP